MTAMLGSETMTTSFPPALANHPQFTAQYWAKAPRETKVAHILRVTGVEDGWVEIAMKEGMALRRRRSEIQQLLAPNAEVHIETFNKELVTGLFVPGVGWAFRMTAQDLADYAKELALRMHEQERATEQVLVLFLTETIANYFGTEPAGGEDAGSDIHDISQVERYVPAGLARIIVAALKEGPA